MTALCTHYHRLLSHHSTPAEALEMADFIWDRFRGDDSTGGGEMQRALFWLQVRGTGRERREGKWRWIMEISKYACFTKRGMEIPNYSGCVHEFCFYFILGEKQFRFERRRWKFFIENFVHHHTFFSNILLLSNFWCLVVYMCNSLLLCASQDLTRLKIGLPYIHHMFESGMEHRTHRKTSSTGGGGTKAKVSVASSFDEQVEERTQSMERGRRGSNARCAPLFSYCLPLPEMCINTLLLYVSSCLNPFPTFSPSNVLTLYPPPPAMRVTVSRLWCQSRIWRRRTHSPLPHLTPRSLGPFSCWTSGSLR